MENGYFYHLNYNFASYLLRFQCHTPFSDISFTFSDITLRNYLMCAQQHETGNIFWDCYWHVKLCKRSSQIYNKKSNDKAAIESGGLCVNGQFSEPTRLNELPEEYHPRNVQILAVAENVGFVPNSHCLYLSDEGHRIFKYTVFIFVLQYETAIFCTNLKYNESKRWERRGKT